MLLNFHLLLHTGFLIPTATDPDTAVTGVTGPKSEPVAVPNDSVPVKF
jgi:hypothetical protein